MGRCFRSLGRLSSTVWWHGLSSLDFFKWYRGFPVVKLSEESSECHHSLNFRAQEMSLVFVDSLIVLLEHLRPMPVEYSRLVIDQNAAIEEARRILKVAPQTCQGFTRLFPCNGLTFNSSYQPYGMVPYRTIVPICVWYCMAGLELLPVESDYCTSDLNNCELADCYHKGIIIADPLSTLLPT